MLNASAFTTGGGQVDHPSQHPFNPSSVMDHLLIIFLLCALMGASLAVGSWILLRRKWPHLSCFVAAALLVFSITPVAWGSGHLALMLPAPYYISAKLLFGGSSVAGHTEVLYWQEAFYFWLLLTGILTAILILLTASMRRPKPESVVR